MRTEINNDPWECPACNEELDAEECAEIRETIQSRGQIVFSCDGCSEPLTADNTSCPSGFVDINEDWVYG